MNERVNQLHEVLILLLKAANGRSLSRSSLYACLVRDAFIQMLQNRIGCFYSWCEKGGVSFLVSTYAVYASYSDRG